MTWDRTAPYDDKGSLLHYPGNQPIWKPIEDFQATLVYQTYNRGRSAAYFTFADKKGVEYPVFMKEFDEIILRMVVGMVTGTWTVTKRGRNFGLKLKTSRKT